MNKKIGIVACGLLALSLTGCQKKVEEPASTEVPTATPDVTEEVSNPVVGYETAEALAEVVGFDITSYAKISSVIEEVSNSEATIMYELVGDDVAQVRVDYGNGAYIQMRASKTVEGIEALAGIYTTVEGVEYDDGSLEYNIMSEDGNKFTNVTTYSEDDVNFSIALVAPINDDTDTPATEEAGDVIEVTEETTEAE